MICHNSGKLHITINLSTIIISHLAVISKPINKMLSMMFYQLFMHYLPCGVHYQKLNFRIAMPMENINIYMYVSVPSLFLMSTIHFTHNIYVVILILCACAVSYFLCHTNLFNSMYYCLSMFHILHV